jgi:nucleoside-diphosphate-sugar epimerase
MSTRRILVTGANGYIGKYVVPILLQNKFEVHGITKSDTLNAKKTNDQLGILKNSAHWHSLDLLQDSPDQIIELVKPTHLLHLAWNTEHGKFWTAKDNTEWLEASLNLMKSFYANRGKRFVFAGSVAEYDWHEGQCIEGLTPEVPHTLYGQTKKAFTDALLKFSRDNNKSAAIGRIFFLYGPGEPQGRIIPAVIHAIKNQEICKCTEGTQVRDFMYVGDVADAMATLVDSNLQGIVNLASGEPQALKTIIINILKQMQATGYDANIDSIQFGVLARGANDPDLLTASTKRLNEELNWRPKVTLDNGLKLTIENILERT